MEPLQGIGGASLLQDEHVESIWREIQEQNTAAAAKSQQHHAVQLRGKLTHGYIDPIASRQWKVVLSWVAFHPDELSTYTDRSGQTALHHAVLFRAPAVIVEAMLYSSCPEIASYSNEEGELPLHWAVRLAAPFEILQLLVQSYPEGGSHADTSGQTPLSLLWDRHEESLVGQTNRADLCKSYPWKRLLLLAKACSCCGDHFFDMQEFPLHALAACPTPTSMLQFALGAYEEDTTIFDSMGRSPLAVAAAAPKATTDNMQLLLNSNRLAARSTDSSGRLPLHWAAASGKSWATLNLIIQAEPSAIRVRDPVTRLYPFQLSAVDRWLANDKVLRTERGNASPDRDLEVIYHMLRACPECVQRFS